ncbi:hypothetical protein ACO2Q0_14765 [Phenylobacterium sp. VNQ135]|uniref:hypothetical protein n=1 Tax=Phenylobacterium sp. VNQ135 TaxID=3400922 RepID=UPI003C05E08C
MDQASPNASDGQPQRLVRGAMILFFISAALLAAMVLSVSSDVSFAALTSLIRRHADMFTGFFYSILSFTLFYIIIVFILASRMFLAERIFALLACAISAGNTVLSFALLYGALGLKRDGVAILPSAFESVFFSSMVFSGNGWAEYSPNANSYTVVAVQSVASYVFMPLLLSALVLLLDVKTMPLVGSVFSGRESTK